MAKHLWFLRHAEAEPHDARPDDKRLLTPRGEEQARAAGRALAALELPFQLALTSPLVRSLDTARLACETLGCKPVVEDSLSKGFHAKHALELARAAGPHKRVLLVGHNPDFEEVLRDLTGASVHVKKGGIAGVRLDGDRGTLLILLRPREIARIGELGSRYTRFATSRAAMSSGS
jgi:phosphohistidine phosphatase